MVDPEIMAGRIQNPGISSHAVAGQRSMSKIRTSDRIHVAALAMGIPNISYSGIT